VPAAAVIPASRVYVIVAAVKRSVVGAGRCPEIRGLEAGDDWGGTPSGRGAAGDERTWKTEVKFLDLLGTNGGEGVRQGCFH